MFSQSAIQKLSRCDTLAIAQMTSFVTTMMEWFFDSLCIQVPSVNPVCFLKQQQFNMSRIYPPIQLSGRSDFSRWLITVPNQQPFKQCCGSDSRWSVINWPPGCGSGTPRLIKGSKKFQKVHYYIIRNDVLYYLFDNTFLSMASKTYR